MAQSRPGTRNSIPPRFLDHNPTPMPGRFPDPNPAERRQLTAMGIAIDSNDEVPGWRKYIIPAGWRISLEIIEEDIFVYHIVDANAHPRVSVCVNTSLNHVHMEMFN